MKNKYRAFAIVSTKNLIFNSSMAIGFFFNFLLMLSFILYLLIFNSETNPMHYVILTEDNFFAIKIVLILLLLILFNGVSLSMQDIMQDRDSKVSEIINTSISERHYVFGKMVASISFMLTYILSLIVSFIITATIFTIFTKTDFNVYNDIVKGALLFITDYRNFTIIISSFFVIFLTMIMSLCLTYSLSVKVSKLAEAPPVALVILLPYIIVIVMLILFPAANINLWNNIMNYGKYIPVISGMFIFSDLIINGLTIVNIISIVVSIFYLIIAYISTINIYKYAFYLRGNFKYMELIKMGLGIKQIASISKN